MNPRGRTHRQQPSAGLSVVRMIAAGLLLISAATAGVSAEPPDAVSRPESRLLNRSIPDIPLQLADDRTTTMSSLWQDKPLLVTFFYGRCHGICTPFLEWIRDAADEVGGLGRDYRILALSFDEEDTIADLRGQAHALRLTDNPDWLFAVTEREDIERITGALEFWYRLQPATGQYDHSALLVAIKDGRVVGALLGGPGYADRFKDLVSELRGQFIPFYKLPNQSPWTCFSFDPASGRLQMNWGLLILGVPTLAGILLTLGLSLHRPRHQ
jgi:cytochrome oxidase Cu insertion factor (SCO1/SenC/PrrC family)